VAAGSAEDTVAQRLTWAVARETAVWRARTSTVGSGAAASNTGCRGGVRGEASGRAVGATPLWHGARTGMGTWQPRGDGALTGGPGAGSGG
jgi:hypothetical protein